jgi:hypothetical protein
MMRQLDYVAQIENDCAWAFFQSADKAKDESKMYDKISYIIMWSFNWIDSNDLQETSLRLFMKRKCCLHSLALTAGFSDINAEVVGIDRWLWNRTLSLVFSHILHIPHSKKLARPCVWSGSDICMLPTLVLPWTVAKVHHTPISLFLSWLGLFHKIPVPLAETCILPRALLPR